LRRPARAELPVEILLVSFGMLLPLTIAVGILVTFRIAGPIYRFESYIKSVLRGEEVGPCRIRMGDEFQELCELLNQVTAALREQRANDERRTLEHEREELRKAG
jgi:signal peptidase II